MPVTCGEVAKPVFVVSEKPVMKVWAAGLTPMSPVMADGGTVEMAALAKTAKPAAVPRLTGASAGAEGCATLIAGRARSRKIESVCKVGFIRMG